MAQCDKRQRIRLLMIVGGLNLGGIERLITDMCRVLIRCGKYDISICCLLSKDGPFLNDIESMGVAVYECLRRSSWRFVKFTRNLTDLMRVIRPDIVHSHLHWSVPSQVLAARASGVPSIIITRHRIAVRTGLSLARQRIYAGLMRRSINLFTAVSEAVRDNIAQHGWATSDDNIAVIPNGIDLSVFGSNSLDNDTAKRRLGLGTKPIVGTVGSLRPDKGHKYLIEASRKILDTGIDCRFVIIGSGNLQAELEDQISKLGLVADVSLLGSQRDIPELLSALDVFVLPSVSEGQGIALVEALASGLLCIGSNVGGIPEVLDGGRAGILVPPKDPQALAKAIIEVLSNKERAMQLSAAAKERAKAFSIETCVAEYEKIYRQLIMKNGYNEHR
ncbi:MAG: glycosyltransferase [Candidatus Coatesbacteria bacterium]|nr:glycosyltransferase [Candidatus Coatesbacteria bacterium]